MQRPRSYRPGCCTASHKMAYEYLHFTQNHYILVAYHSLTLRRKASTVSFTTPLVTIGQGQGAQNDPWVFITLIAVAVAAVCALTAVHTRSPRIRIYAILLTVIGAFALIAIMVLNPFAK